MDNENKSICAACAATRGEKTCCRSYPGIASPDDFAGNGQTLEEALYVSLSSGKWAIDWWDNHDGPDDYFIRPAVKGCEGKLEDPSWGGACTFLTDKGCKFKYDERPEGCRALIPNPDGTGKCGAEGGWGEKSYKRHGADLWLPHRGMITKLIDRINKEAANE